ncbi:MAG: hypothetical protein IKM80_00585 [Bacilli bacterium]|nr:hypothetical protein [Bacilli bacterium]
MKFSKILMASAMLTSMMLASCGNGEGEQSKPAGASTSSVKASSSKSSSSKFVAQWSKDASLHVEPTCESEGKDVEVCINSSMPNKETALPKKAHTWGTKSEKVTAEGKTGYWTNECSVCHTKAIIIDALDWTKIEGSNKDNTGATLKFSTNGNYAEYEFNMPTALTNVTVGVYGWVDYWKDGSNNNDQRGFFSTKAGDGSANVGVKLNDTDLTITNKKTYEEMGMTAGENGNSSFCLCEMGTVASIAAGDFKLTYTRLESYNLNITEIWLMYK